MEEAIEQPAGRLSSPRTAISPLRVLRVALGYGLPLGSLALHFVVMLCFINRWDRVAAVTVFPIWFWAMGGMVLALVGWLVLRSRLGIAIAFVWFATALFVADETRGMIRIFQEKLTETHPGTFHGKKVYRVVTLNCSKRNAEAAAEVKRFDPDIVLLQEVPRAGEIQTLGKELFGDEGSVMVNWHCAVLARGSMVRAGNSANPPYEFATVTLPDGPRIDVFSIHLEHAVTRWDLWNPECWGSHARNRRERRSQLRRALEHYARTPGAGSRPCLFGGDFNAPPTDQVFDLLDHHFDDAFRTAGRGWGNTFFNRLPALRIDQIWMTEKLIPINARAVPTEHSDHRMLVVDFIVNG